MTGLARWVLFDIPIGTVLPEEFLFRGVVDTVATVVVGPRAALVVGSTAFGVWHWYDSGRSVPVVLFTGAAGALFVDSKRRTGTILTPMALHWAANSIGAVASTWWRSTRGDRPPRG